MVEAPGHRCADRVALETQRLQQLDERRTLVLRERAQLAQDTAVQRARGWGMAPRRGVGN